VNRDIFSPFIMRIVNTIICFLIIISLHISCKTKQVENTVSPQVVDSTKINKQPKNLEEAITYFETIWNDSTKDEFKNKAENDAVIDCHFGVGMWIRNQWLRGDRNPAFSKFFEDLGVHDMDEISSIVMIALHRRLNGKDVGLDSMVIKYKIREKHELERYERISAESLSTFNKFKIGDMIVIQMPVTIEEDGTRLASNYVDCLSTEWNFDTNRDLEMQAILVAKHSSGQSSTMYFDVKIRKMNFENTLIIGDTVRTGDIVTIDLGSLKIKKALPLTPAKPQAATQAITPSLRPRPSYPLGGMLEPVSFGSCNCESNIQEKETTSEVVQRS